MTIKANTVVERTYRARVEELWDLWTTKEGFESWWGPEGFRVEVYTLEPRPGGTLHYSMIAAAPEQVAALRQLDRPPSHEVHARFAEVKPLQRLAIVNTIDFLPEVDPYESQIVVEFFPSAGTVRMVVTLEAMHDEQITRMSRIGFTSQLTKLDRRFAAG